MPSFLTITSPREARAGLAGLADTVRWRFSGPALVGPPAWALLGSAAGPPDWVAAQVLTARVRAAMAAVVPMAMEAGFTSPMERSPWLTRPSRIIPRRPGPADLEEPAVRQGPVMSPAASGRRVARGRR